MSASGPLTPAMLQYLARGVNYAEDRNAELVIFQLNTPGGEIELLNRMVTVIRESHVPVIIFIAPRGAMAGSAGTVITLAGHAAAMAPETAIGAASPVGSQGEDVGETMQAKAKEILRATVRSLAERRSPEAVALAEDTIQNARAVSSVEALEVGLIDFIATDTNDLLAQLDGYTVHTVEGAVVLRTSGIAQDPVESSLLEQILQLLTNPNIVFLLLSIGVQAVLIELSSSGRMGGRIYWGCMPGASHVWTRHPAGQLVRNCHSAVILCPFYLGYQSAHPWRINRGRNWQFYCRCTDPF